MAARHRGVGSYITGMFRSKPGRRVRSITRIERGVWSGKDALIKFRFDKGGRTRRAGWKTVGKYR